MLDYQLNLLNYFTKHERAFDGSEIHWHNYSFHTMQELDRLREEIGSPCRLMRGGHGFQKETAIDAVFPQAPFGEVVMALFRTGFSKGVYEGGSIHLDGINKGDTGLARCWLAFKPERREAIADLGLIGLKDYSKDGWDYYHWGLPRSWELLCYLIQVNS